MNTRLLLATGDGLVALERRASAWCELSHGLRGHELTAVIAREGVILAGSTAGVFRSDDLGQTWELASTGLSHPHVRWLAYHPALSDCEFAGTEPAGIFVSHDGGAAWRDCPEVAALRDAHAWFLPYSPEAGCVRSFALLGSRAYAAVEVGGVLRSDDSGETWALVPGSSGEPSLGLPPPPWIHADVHSLAGHSSSPDIVWAATHSGLYRTADAGAAWDMVYGDNYCRAVWVDPTAPERIVFAPSTPHGWDGRIEETTDGGRSWHMASEGLNAPLPETPVERLTQVGTELFAVLSDGRVFSAPLDRLVWQPFVPEVTGVVAVAEMIG